MSGAALAVSSELIGEAVRESLGPFILLTFVNILAHGNIASYGFQYAQSL
jgi:hypothetical protein